jgi:pimeloyl-ACP methyl ester carboxylesterase
MKSFELQEIVMLKSLYKAVLLCAVVLMTTWVSAQDEVQLVPFSDEAFGISGVIPQGWISPSPGLFVRQKDNADGTLLVIQSAFASPESVWTSLLPQLGLDNIPESVGSLQTASLDWSLYQVEVTAQGLTVSIDLGLANANGRTYSVLLQSASAEAMSLRESVFMPVMEGLEPIQTDVEEIPYQVEEVTFSNGAITLSGTLTIPLADGLHPAVVLMTGSGPQTRDEEIVPGFPIFALIADALTRQGVAVLRYDDRGVGQSTGDHSAASIQDFASDGQAAVRYLHTHADIDPAQIGVLGHSEGSLYAAMLSANPQSGVAFAVSLAGPAVVGYEGIIHQTAEQYRVTGVPQAFIDLQVRQLHDIFGRIVANDDVGLIAAVERGARETWDVLPEAQRTNTGAANVEDYVAQSIVAAQTQLASAYYRSLLSYNPADDWACTTIPVLVIFGSLDVQVDEVQNAVPFTQALVSAGNQDFSVVVLPGVNHLFQTAITGSADEYFSLTREFTPALLPTIIDWVLRHVTLPQE